MAQKYQDAMAIVRELGKPDVFMTMTCNPDWDEIQGNAGVKVFFFSQSHFLIFSL
jgi:hypothetical protein